MLLPVKNETGEQCAESVILRTFRVARTRKVFQAPEVGRNA